MVKSNVQHEKLLFFDSRLLKFNNNNKLFSLLFSFNFQSLTENSPTSGGIESEYDTASTNSRSDNEHDEYEDDDDDADEEEDSVIDEGTGDEHSPTEPP